MPERDMQADEADLEKKRRLSERHAAYPAEVDSAKRSGRPFRHVNDAEAGPSVEFLSDAEISDAQARTEAEKKENESKDRPVTAKSVLDALIAKGVITQADLDGKA